MRVARPLSSSRAADLGDLRDPLGDQLVDEGGSIQGRLRLDRILAVGRVRHPVSGAERSEELGHHRESGRQGEGETAEVRRAGFVDQRLTHPRCGGKPRPGQVVVVGQQQPGGRLGLQPFAHVPAVQPGAARELCGGERPVQGQRSEQAVLQPDVDSAEMKRPDPFAEEPTGQILDRLGCRLDLGDG